MEEKNFSISENIILLKEGLNQLIVESQIPIDIVVYVLKDYLNELQTVSNQYQNQLYQALNEKIEAQRIETEKQELDNKIQEENPDLQVSIVNKEEK